MIVLTEADWRARAAAHAERVRRWTGPHLDRRHRGEPHPVLDFLFTYYSYRPAQLERWHPGVGVTLRGAVDDFGRQPAYVVTGDEVRLAPERLPDRLRATATFVAELLDATAKRPPTLGCFGLHEWAMVYRTSEPRHDHVPLRLGPAGTNAVVEQMSIRCTHHDAFRFFTDAARPRNAHQPSRQDQVRLEQPGCLHANMDLYKWAYKLAPATPSDLVADCFALARDVRELDMRASPYDLAAYGYEPVRIETASGRAAYVRAQQEFARRAAPLRQALIDVCRTLAQAWDEPGPTAGSVPARPASARRGHRPVEDARPLASAGGPSVHVPELSTMIMGPL